MYSTIMNIYVVVTFLYPKTKEKQKLPEIMNNLQHKHYLFTGSEKKLASYGTVIRNLCSESQNEISDDLKY